MDFLNFSSEISFESTFESVDSSVDNISGAELKTEEKPQSNDLIEKIMLFYLRHNLTLVCLEDVMKLLNGILDDCEKLPTGKVQILNMFRQHRDLVDILYFVKCDKCRKHTKIDSENKNNIECLRCGKSVKTTEANYFVSMPIEKQIMKSVKDNWSYIKEFETTSDTNSKTYSDARDGAILRKVLNKYLGSDLNILSLGLNVDGANKFKSNKKYNSCTYCDIPGELVVVENLKKNKKMIKKPKNAATVPQKKQNKFVRYVEGSGSYKLRGEVETLEKMLLASKFNGESPIDGIKDVSCVVSLEHFHIIWSISPEYMHSCLLGATKRMFDFFFNSKYSGKDYYIAPMKRKTLNMRILGIKPTSSIVRKPRSLKQRSNYKASEYRSILFGMSNCYMLIE